MPRTATKTKARGDIYGDVNSPADIRKINTMIRGQMDRVRSREDLTELKKRSDYLCALSMAPSWKTKFGAEIDDILREAKEENRKTVEVANRIARDHDWDANYDPWGD